LHVLIFIGVNYKLILCAKNSFFKSNFFFISDLKIIKKDFGYCSGQIRLNFKIRSKSTIELKKKSFRWLQQPLVSLLAEGHNNAKLGQCKGCCFVMSLGITTTLLSLLRVVLTRIATTTRIYIYIYIYIYCWLC